MKMMRSITCMIMCLLISVSLVACGGTGTGSTPSSMPIPSMPGSQGANPDDIIGKTDKNLLFDADGNFKVLILSDIRMPAKGNVLLAENIQKILDATTPSLVILGGDVHDGSVTNEQELRMVLDAITKPIEDRQIFWCHAFGVDTEGTADQKSGYSRAEQMKVYTSYEYCVSQEGQAANAYGVSNYVLPILVPDKDQDMGNNKVGFNVWCLDSNGYLNDYIDGLESKVVLKRTQNGGTNLDCLHYSQLIWYWNTSVAFENRNGSKVPGMMYVQVPPYQFMLIKRNQQITKMVGEKSSIATKVDSSERESGVVWACYERGDIRGLFSGYNEENDYSGTYLDMTMGFCSTIGKSGFEGTRGARLVTISKNGANMETSMVYLKDLL